MKCNKNKMKVNQIENRYLYQKGNLTLNNKLTKLNAFVDTSSKPTIPHRHH